MASELNFSWRFKAKEDNRKCDTYIMIPNLGQVVLGTCREKATVELMHMN